MERISFQFVDVATGTGCQLKCHPYYPTGSENEGEDELEFADVGLKVTYVEEKESNVHYTARVFYITDTEVQIPVSYTHLTLPTILRV